MCKININFYSSKSNYFILDFFVTSKSQKDSLTSLEGNFEQPALDGSHKKIVWGIIEKYDFLISFSCIIWSWVKNDPECKINVGQIECKKWEKVLEHFNFVYLAKVTKLN